MNKQKSTICLFNKNDNDDQWYTRTHSSHNLHFNAADWFHFFYQNGI